MRVRRNYWVFFIILFLCSCVVILFWLVLKTSEKKTENFVLSNNSTRNTTHQNRKGKVENISSTSAISNIKEEEKFQKCKIEGIVIDKITNVPIRGARVVLDIKINFRDIIRGDREKIKFRQYPYNENKFVAETDENGRFFFIIPSLNWSLNFEVTHDNYSMNWVQEVMQEGDTYKAVNIRLCNCVAEIFGVVRDWKGGVVEEVRVMAFDVEIVGEENLKNLYKEHFGEPKNRISFTDKEGKYYLKLPAGVYGIRASKKGYDVYQFPSCWEHSPIYVPPRSRIQHDITLASEPVGFITFRLVDPEGKPLEEPISEKGSQLTIEGFDIIVREDRFIRRDILITKGSKAGEYKLSQIPVNKPLYLSIYSTKGVYKPKEIGHFLAPIDLGDIRLEYYRNRVGELRVKIKNSLEGEKKNVMYALLQMYDSEDEIPSHIPSYTTVEKKSEVIFSQVLPGKYIVAAKQGELAGMAVVELHPGEVKEVNIMLNKGASLRGKIISLSKKSFSIGIGKRVIGDEKITIDDKFVFLATVNADNEGNFSIDGIPPGDWELMVYSPEHEIHLLHTSVKPKVAINIKVDALTELEPIIIE